MLLLLLVRGEGFTRTLRARPACSPLGQAALLDLDGQLALEDLAHHRLGRLAYQTIGCERYY